MDVHVWTNYILILYMYVCVPIPLTYALMTFHQCPSLLMYPLGSRVDHMEFAGCSQRYNIYSVPALASDSVGKCNLHSLHIQWHTSSLHATVPTSFAKIDESYMEYEEKGVPISISGNIGIPRYTWLRATAGSNNNNHNNTRYFSPWRVQNSIMV